MDTSLRPLGRSGLLIPPFGLGCWPLAGMTREGITRDVAVAIVEACYESARTGKAAAVRESPR